MIRLLQKSDQIKGLLIQHHPAGLQLVHIENAVDQIQQKARCLPHLAAACPLLFRIIGKMIGNGNHALDPVDRRPDIMAHAPQEIGLCHVGAAGVLGCLQKLLPVLDLHLLLFIDLAHHI